MVLLKIIREKDRNDCDRIHTGYGTKVVVITMSWVYYKNSYQGFQISLFDNILNFK